MAISFLLIIIFLLSFLSSIYSFIRCVPVFFKLYSNKNNNDLKKEYYKYIIQFIVSCIIGASTVLISIKFN